MRAPSTLSLPASRAPEVALGRRSPHSASRFTTRIAPSAYASPASPRAAIQSFTGRLWDAHLLDRLQPELTRRHE